MDARMFISLLWLLAFNAVFSISVPLNNIERDELFSLFGKKMSTRSVTDNEVDTSFEGIHNNQLKTDKSCKDLYTFTCNEKKSKFHHYNYNDTFVKLLEKNFIQFSEKIKELLMQEDWHDVQDLKVEQQLYQNCMKLGDSKDENESENETNEGTNEEVSQDVGEEINEEENKTEHDDVNQEEVSQDEGEEVNEEGNKNEDDNVNEEEVVQDQDNLNKEENNDGENVNQENGENQNKENENKDVDSINDMFYGMIKKFDENLSGSTWQEIDNKLVSLGFEYAFFDIDVINDPTDLTKNIIELEPPSIKKWNSIKLTDVIADLYLAFQLASYEACRTKLDSDEPDSEPDYSKVNAEDAFLESDEHTDEEDVNKSDDNNNETNENNSESVDNGNESNDDSCNIYSEYRSKEESLFTSLYKSEDDESLKLFNKILKAIFDSMDITNKETLHKKMTIHEWNEIYNNDLPTDSTARIDWLKIIKDKFERVGIDVSENEVILIRNYPYFVQLRKILKFAEKDLLVYAIQSKFVAENIRYYDWNEAASINYMDKSKFCMNQLHLYGATKVALKDFSEKSKEYTVGRRHADPITKKIIKTLDNDISKSKKLSDKKKTLLRNELSKLFKELAIFYPEKYDEDYYEDYTITGDVFDDFKNYRNMLKNKSLRTLRENPSEPSNRKPLDLADMDNPRNRFLLYIMSSAISLSQALSEPSRNTAPSSHKQVREELYAIYGVSLAGFLYSLLKEKSFENDLRDHKYIEWMNPKMTYTDKEVTCFVPEDIVEYGYASAYSTITDIYNLRLAYEALKSDAPNDPVDKTFFTSYIKERCGDKNKQKEVNKVLSYFKETSKVFGCPKYVTEHKKCNLKAF